MSEPTAYELLVRAFEVFLTERGYLKDGWAIGDFLAVVELTPFAEGLDGRQRYSLILPEPTIPTHRALGLLPIAEDLIAQDDDEDD